jgi:hypothetical protein
VPAAGGSAAHELPKLKSAAPADMNRIDLFIDPLLERIYLDVIYRFASILRILFCGTTVKII